MVLVMRYSKRDLEGREFRDGKRRTKRGLGKMLSCMLSLESRVMCGLESVVLKFRAKITNSVKLWLVMISRSHSESYFLFGASVSFSVKDKV